MPRPAARPQDWAGALGSFEELPIGSVRHTIRAEPPPPESRALDSMVSVILLLLRFPSVHDCIAFSSSSFLFILMRVRHSLPTLEDFR